MRSAGHRDLEFTSEPVELRMQGRPLPDPFGDGPRIFDLVMGDASEMIGGDVANAVSGCLNAMHLDIGEQTQDSRHVFEFGPVELQVLAGGEMSVAAIVDISDMGQLPQLLRAQSSVGNGDSQHIGVQLQIEAVFEAQRTKFVIAQRTV